MQEKKYRHELKYICSATQIAVLKSRVQSVLPMDVNVGEKGFYNIRSLYFDDYENSGFWDKEDGVNLREKYRIRVYDYSLERISLEVKEKRGNLIHKESCQLSREQYVSLREGKENQMEVSGDNAPLLNRFLVTGKQAVMVPKVIVEYERIPFIYHVGNVRITFDENIASIPTEYLLEDERAPKRMILPGGQQLLEVKFDEFLPDYIYRILQLENMRQTAFSKYCLCRKFAV
ncbi:MAG: polyphosphate polymerase domain-containing protein [Lachnospiraceae bacterium]|nr:polyphosphate polymerase domain-containing protein [Lachnospiraceae bacterium]